MSVDPNAVRAISWAELKAGRWTSNYTTSPCCSGLLAVGRRWREWPLGRPPTWAEFASAPEISAADRRWLVARVLLRDRRRLAAWAVDCAEAVVHLAGAAEAAIRADVIEPLRAWIAGDDSIDLAAVRCRAWAICHEVYDAVAAYAASATAYDAAATACDAYDADAAEAADAAAAADAATDAAMLRLALPHLAALESRP